MPRQPRRSRLHVPSATGPHPAQGQCATSAAPGSSSAVTDSYDGGHSRGVAVAREADGEADAHAVEAFVLNPDPKGRPLCENCAEPIAAHDVEALCTLADHAVRLEAQLERVQRELDQIRGSTTGGA